MNTDITFCSHKDCNNKKCRRNLNNYSIKKDEIIWLTDFSENCGYLEKELKNEF